MQIYWKNRRFVHFFNDFLEIHLWKYRYLFARNQISTEGYRRLLMISNNGMTYTHYSNSNWQLFKVFIKHLIK